MYKPGWTSGKWSAICDVCGFRFHSNELRDRWDGLKVCAKDWETRHPQDFIKAKIEQISPPWVRPEIEDTFLEICYLWELSGYAGLAAADCAKASNTSSPYQFLLELRT